MINTPAGFGRAINFGNPAGFPVWRAGEAIGFPNAIGWQQIFQTSFINIPPDPVYGQPFITAHSGIDAFLSYHAAIDPVIDLQSVIKPTISKYVQVDPDISGMAEIDEDA